MENEAAATGSRARDGTLSANDRTAILSDRGRGDIVYLAVSLAVGIAFGWYQSEFTVWPWMVIAGVMLIVAVCVRRFRALFLFTVCIVLMLLGASWVTIRNHYTSSDDLAAWLDDEPVLVTLTGTSLQTPVNRTRSAGSMAVFDYRQPVTYFPMEVDSLIARNGDITSVSGEVLVRIDETVSMIKPGDRIEASGYLTRPSQPHNPGEFDYSRYARALDQAGFLSVASRELMTITSGKKRGLLTTLQTWREHVRQRAGAWLLSDLPQTDRTKRDWLLVRLLLGERDPLIDGTYESFQRVGLAHILAISGFHLGVLAGFVLLVARTFGGYQRWHALLVIVVVLFYLFLVELRMPVLRAGVMTIAGCIGLLGGRHLRAGGLVALSAVMLLLWRPDQVYNAGFQLSYGVVLGLIYLVPGVRRRWFGPPNALAPTIGAMALEWLKSTMVVSVVAWMVATPIAAFHFGMVAPLGAPLAVLAIPFAAALLALGYVKMVVAAVLPSASLILGVPLSIGADVMVTAVLTIDTLPFSTFHVPFPSWFWSCAAVSWVVWWASGPLRIMSRRVMWASLVILIGWLITPAALPWGGALRIDMFSVGDGSCYVIRSGSNAVMFDAGSGSDLNAARRMIIPAMRRLGIGSLDAVVISHANTDHYSAVLDLAREFPVDEILVTPQFVRHAEADVLGPAAFLLQGLTDHRTPFREVSASDEQTFGSMKWTWLHPHAEDEFRIVNDTSMVIRIEAGGRRVLLCGDIQNDAMDRLMDSPIDLAADIVELPHHGSFHESAPEFLRHVRPSVVLQSTAWWRWERDRWADHLQGIDRLVTARDGACWIEINDEGVIYSRRFSPRKTDDLGH